MSNNQAETLSKRKICIAVIVAGCTCLLIVGLANIIAATSATIKAEKCAQNDQVLDEDSGDCRDKTVSEKFTEECSGTHTYGDQTYTCSQIENAGLEQAFLSDTIVAHGSAIYEQGTTEEIAAGKKAGDYCISASDTWSYIGERRCVYFSYVRLACSNGYCFLNEKYDYNNGFVVFFGTYNMYTWDEFYATYQGGGTILVCGTIYTYNGHPEIRIVSPSEQIEMNPTKSYSGSSVVYRYTCT